MGDGAVVCMPSQQRDIMERFPVSESAWGGGVLGLVPEKKMREAERKERAQKQEERSRKVELEKGGLAPERRRKGERARNGELEKGEFVPERSHKGELEKGEFVPDKWRRGELEVGEFVPDEWRKWEEEKPEQERGRGRKVELEKGEFVPDKWRKGVREHSQEDFYQRKEAGSRKEGERRNLEKGELVADKWQKVDKKHTPEDCYQKKEVGGRNQSEQRKRSSLKCDGSVNEWRSELGSHKHEVSNGKGHGKDHNATSSLKRHCMETENSTRKHHGDFGDNSGSKSRRISEDSNSRPGHQDKPHNSSTVPSRNSSINRYSSSRHHESPLPSRGHDRHAQKPGCLEQSPHDRTHQHHHRDRSPVYSERSPHDRARHNDHRDRTPGFSEKSPHERLRHYDRRDRTPGCRDRSPHDRARHHDHRDRTPCHLEKSPHNSGQVLSHREGSRKGAGGEKQLGRYEEKPGRRDPDGRDSVKHNSVRLSNNSASCPDKIAPGKSNKEKESHKSVADSSELPPPPPFSPPPLPPPPPPANGFPEDSMEEDMDICDTPPHAALPADQNLGKWYYLDNYGLERGPSKLADLKRLVEEGVLPSDHLIKHFDSDRWVTVENATSPLLSVSLTSIVSDALTQMVSPPEASGNLLVDDGDIAVEMSLPTVQPEMHHQHDWDLPESLKDLRIDERIDALLAGYDIIPGRELETIGEALKVSFEHVEWEKWTHSEGFTRSRAHAFDVSRHSREDGAARSFDGMSKEGVEPRYAATCEKELAFVNSDSSDWFAGLWSCKGGDWKRSDDNVHDRYQKRKLVLNEGYPLCQMPKCGDEDPRWHRKDDLYYPTCSKKLDLPPWAFSWTEDKNESNNDSSKCMLAGRSSQIKSLIARGVKGILLPVTRINACVVRDHGSLSESRPRFKSSERHSSRSVRSYGGSGDKSSFSEVTSRSKKVNQHECSQKYKESVNTPKDHICTVDELSMHLGDWYYLDGAGHERGPFLFPELQDLVAKGTILKHSSVFRKVDGIWIPITENTMASEAACIQEEKGPKVGRSASDSVSHSHVSDASLHSSHSQFIGYTRGKLHELVMKSYKSREFAAAINEVLDPWITAKQPKKEMEKHFAFNSSITKSSVVLSHDSPSDKFWRTDGDASGIYGHAGKRARLMFDESDEDYEQEDDYPTGQKNDILFEDLCGESVFDEENFMSSQVDTNNWGLLNGHILARIFHFLRADIKSLICSAATCKQWRAAVKFYRSVSRQVDLSHLGSICTDSVFRVIMSDYDKNSITSIILSRCTNISASALEEILHLFPGISSIDIRGCNQFRELAPLFQNVRWIKSRASLSSKNLEESHSKMKSLKRITDKSFSSVKPSKDLDDLGNATNLDAHDFHLDLKDPGIHTFRQGYYKRTRLPDARKSSAALSRDAHLRQLLRKKSVTAYRKMEEFIGMRLKEIMKGNTFEFFVLRVAEIEEKMKNGHYSRHGLSSVKEDISRMCRDALKVKRCGDSGDMKQVIMLFFQLAKNLENPKPSFGRDDRLRSLRDSLDVGLHSEVSKHRKKHNRNMNDKRLNNRSNNIPYANGGLDYESYEIDRELKRSISKLNRRHMDSESETSEENDLSEDDIMSESDGTTSDTESELDLQLESRADDGKDGHFMWDDSMDASDDREWGARMTKASLVPPVTRKYEVIDKYLVVADEEEVKRKMSVALPEDYDEKVQAQKSGLEESDMEIPEVKDYKPRKMLGIEVIEQEVYGIDPYTHNLLLDSMPDEAEWPLVEKQKFIEEVLLRTLNKQVRHFTGSGNTPMVYPLKSVIEEIKKAAEESAESHLVKLCHAILKAMQSRPDDNYVAYRKGLGVVCNKEGGFDEDDFVVEFLGEVYPSWKWFEKQDGIRSLQKNSKDPAPEFYNIYLERPKGDRDGYDLVVVDAMHKANYASRICHSCRPNCEAKVTAVDGQYQIGIYAVRPIAYAEEITFDYNSVTESKEEYEASVCLCGSQVCRGSYLNLTGEDAFQNVLKECHGLLDRHKLILEACEKNYVSQEDYIDLARAGLGPCLLAGLPDWLIAYSAHLVRFMNFERTKLPEQILKHNLVEKRKFFTDICLEAEKSDAEVQAEGVYNQRLQNLALTLDKVRYVMRRVFGDPKEAPPPLERLDPDQLVSALWKGEGSLVEELLQCMTPHVDANVLNDLRSKIRAHDPSGSNLQMELRKSLLWFRDELRELPCSYKCRNDAAADLIHMYAYTKCFFRVREYKAVTSLPVYISPLDLGPKYVDKMGPGFQEYCKTYGENYCLGQLIYWHNQANADPDCSLARARRGCLTLPDIASFYTKSQKPSRERIYSPRTLRFMLARMEKQPQRPWPKDQIWVFRSAPRIFGSPTLDAVLNNCPLDKEMVHWLKSRPGVFEAMWDG